MYRTHNLGELRIENVNQEVELSGWVQKIRNLGGMIFIDLRDQFGITQIVINDEKMQEQVKNVPTESCIHICGKVVEISSKNPKMPTGDIEVVANSVILSKNFLPCSAPSGTTMAFTVLSLNALNSIFSNTFVTS